MSTLINNKIIKTIIEITIFIISIPIITIILKVIYALGIALGTYARTIGI